MQCECSTARLPIHLWPSRLWAMIHFPPDRRGTTFSGLLGWKKVCTKQIHSELLNLMRINPLPHWFHVQNASIAWRIELKSPAGSRAVIWGFWGACMNDLTNGGTNPSALGLGSPTPAITDCKRSSFSTISSWLQFITPSEI